MKDYSDIVGKGTFFTSDRFYSVSRCGMSFYYSDYEGNLEELVDYCQY